MGRKPVDKQRVEDPDKKRAFVEELMPILQANIIHAEIVSCKLEKLRAVVPIINDTSIPYLERYLRAVRLFIDNFHGISTKFLSDVKEFYPAVWDQIDQFREHMNTLVGQFYQEGIDKGVLKDVNPAVLIMSDQLFFTRLIDPDFLQNHNLTIEEVFRDYFKVKLEGAISKDAVSEELSQEIDNIMNNLSNEKAG
ncbi:MAG: hypothetical protein BRD50_04690 [Bacteroidetes bacterium SW_11_45_7]|nr:MAG: hypothetical protein BRD50_04690 [Bacteroidetes bacterium SW_11_45_7]